MTNQRNELDKVAARIRALLDKTVANGCTEGEAISAALKAAEMLSRHDLTMAEVKARGDGFKESVHPHRDMLDQHLWKVADAIAELCQVRTWSIGTGRNSEGLNFFGMAGDVEIATYLLGIVERSMRDSRDAFDRSQALFRKSVRRARVEDFVDAMSSRLRERIFEIAWTRRREAPDGVAEAKLRIIDDEREANGVTLRDIRSAAPRDLGKGYAEGRAAADGVALNAAVSGDGRPSGIIAGR